MSRAADNYSFEGNSDSELARAAGARPAGVAWALFEVAAVVALVVVVRWVWLTWLTAPGLVVAAILLFSPRWNGGALVLGLSATLLGVAGVAVGAVMRARAD